MNFLLKEPPINGDETSRWQFFSLWKTFQSGRRTTSIDSFYIRDGPLPRKTLSKSQRAHQTRCSTVSASSTTVYLVDDKVKAGAFAIGTFIDMEEALNSTLGATIEAGLWICEFSRSIGKLVHYMLAGPTVKAKKRETSFEGRAISGCPEGRVLSAFL